MFIQNEDNSFYMTRGDDCEMIIHHMFSPGDVIRIKITKKKDCNSVLLQRDFTVEANMDTYVIWLSGADTKFDEVISKPTDYWYEIELNPDTAPETIVGYTEDGPAVFRLYPEGKDVEEGDIDAVAPETLQEMITRSLNEALATGAFNGKDAYEIAKEKGFDGTEEEWLESLQGEKGDRADIYTLEGNMNTLTSGTVQIQLFKNGQPCTERVYLVSNVASGSSDWREHGTSTGWFTTQKSWNYGGTEAGMAWRCYAYEDNTRTNLLAACSIFASPKGEVGPTGETGNAYVLTDNDKAEIAELVLASIPNANGVRF